MTNPIKLYLAERDCQTELGGKALVLVDAKGVVVRGQKALSLDQCVDSESTVTVTLIVDGEYLSIGEPPESAQ